MKKEELIAEFDKSVKTMSKDDLADFFNHVWRATKPLPTPCRMCGKNANTVEEVENIVFHYPMSTETQQITVIRQQCDHCGYHGVKP